MNFFTKECNFHSSINMLGKNIGNEREKHKVNIFQPHLVYVVV